MPDIWSLITGFASIVSLFLALGGKLASWKKYTVPATWCLAGFTIGRLSATLPYGFSLVLQDEGSAAFLIIFFAVLVSVALGAYVLQRKNETWLAYMVFLLGISILAPQLIRLYYENNAAISPGDYLLLADSKEEAGSLENAIMYLERYERKVNDQHVKEEIEKRISSLRTRLAERVSHPPVTNR